MPSMVYQDNIKKVTVAMNLLQIFKTQLSTPDKPTRRFLRTWTPHPGSVLFTLVVVGLVLFVRYVRVFPLLGTATQTTSNSTIDSIGNNKTVQNCPTWTRKSILRLNRTHFD